MEQIRLKDVKKGDFFRVKNTPNAPVWVRGEYERNEKKYSCYKYDDVNHEAFYKGDKLVFVDFEF